MLVITDNSPGDSELCVPAQSLCGEEDEVESTDRHLCGSRVGIKGMHTHRPLHPFLRSGLLVCLQRACPQSSVSEHTFSSELAGLSLRGPSLNCMNTLLKVCNALLACPALPGFWQWAAWLLVLRLSPDITGAKLHLTS